MEAKKRHVLKHPFKSLVSKELVDSVDFRTVLKVADFRAARKFSKEIEDQTFMMVSRLSGLADVEVEQLSMADFNSLAEMIDWGGDAEEGKA